MKLFFDLKQLIAVSGWSHDVALDEMSDLEMVLYAVDASHFMHIGFGLVFDCSK